MLAGMLVVMMGTTMAEWWVDVLVWMSVVEMELTLVD